MALCGDTHKGFDIYQAAGRFAIDSPIVSRRVRIESSKTRGKSGTFDEFSALFPRENAVKNKPFPFRTMAAPPYSRVNFSTSSARLFSNRGQLFSSPSVAWKRQSNLFRGKKFSPVKRRRGEERRREQTWNNIEVYFFLPPWKVHIRGRESRETQSDESLE